MEINLAIIDFNPGQGGGVKPSGTLDISENGVYNVYTYGSASVDVHPSVSLSETYISNGSYNITGEFNGGVITVDVPAPQFVTETLNVSTNGTYNPGEGVDGYSKVVVDVPVSGWDQKSFTEEFITFINIDNSASFVASSAFQDNKTIQMVNLPYATSVGYAAFWICSSLSQVNLPMCISIDNAAFMVCSSLSQVNLPMCISIGSDAFKGCSSLSQVNLPMCNSIGGAVFRSCYSLSQVNLPMVKTIGVSAFTNCSALSSLTLCTDVYWTIPFGTRTYGGTPIVNESSSASIYVRSDTYSLWISSKLWSSISSKFVSVPVSGPALSFSNGLLSGTTKAIASDFTSYLSVTTSDITGVSLPECRYIGNQTFQSYNLTQVSLPKCEYIYELAFHNCMSFYQINLPECRYIGDYAFQNCEIDDASLPKCEYLGNGAFHNCWMESITIGYSSVCNINVDTFNGTDIARGTGSIYVPASLVEAYKADSNWSQYSSQIFPIE